MESRLKQWAGGRKHGGKDLHNALVMGRGEVGNEARAMFCYIAGDKTRGVGFGGVEK